MLRDPVIGIPDVSISVGLFATRPRQESAGPFGEFLNQEALAEFKFLDAGNKMRTTQLTRFESKTKAYMLFFRDWWQLRRKFPKIFPVIGTN